MEAVACEVLFAWRGAKGRREGGVGAGGAGLLEGLWIEGGGIVVGGNVGLGLLSDERGMGRGVSGSGSGEGAGICGTGVSCGM